MRGIAIGALCLLHPPAYAAPVLRTAEAHVVFQTSTSCEVDLPLGVDGAAEVEHRVEATEGARVELIEVRGAALAGAQRAIGRTHALVLSPEASTYTLRYAAELPPARAYRCPLWLPTTPADGQARDVRLRVRLPAGATPSGTMPTFAWVGGEGTATLGHLPAFVRVPYALPDQPGPWNVARLMEILSMLVLVAATLWWARRSSRGQAP